MNIAIIKGRLGRDPEVKATKGGSFVCTFSVCTDEFFTKEGSTEKQTEWHNVVAFGKLAEISGNYGFKGGRVYVEGRLKTEKWEKDGVTHYRTKIHAKTIEFLDHEGTSDSKEKPKQTRPQEQDDDVPF
jgi:single-strand DNA-binding protein